MTGCHRYVKPAVMVTFSDASETMLREMNRHLNTALAHRQSNIQSVRLPSKFPSFCYFFDFEARFFNSKCISSAFVDLLRATYVFFSFIYQRGVIGHSFCRCNTPAHNPRMILSYVFHPQREQTHPDFSFLAAGLASRQIHPLWTFVASAPEEFSFARRQFRDDRIKGTSFRKHYSLCDDLGSC